MRKSLQLQITNENKNYYHQHMVFCMDMLRYAQNAHRAVSDMSTGSFFIFSKTALHHFESGFLSEL